MKKYTLAFHPLLNKDIQKVISDYNSKSKGLGSKFSSKVTEGYNSLKINPFYEVRYNDIRCLPIENFPYMIHFRIDVANQIVLIEAIINTSVDPIQNWGVR